MANANKADYDPREYAGWVQAIPKRNLGELLLDRGMKLADLADQLWSDRSRGRVVSEWINGKRRMSDHDIIRVGALLDVSPLYLLDVTLHEWPLYNQMNWYSAYPEASARDIREWFTRDVNSYFSTDDYYLKSHIVKESHFDGFEVHVSKVYAGLTIEFSVDDLGEASTSEIRHRLKRTLLSTFGDFRNMNNLLQEALTQYLSVFDGNSDLLMMKLSEAFREYNRNRYNYGRD